MASNTNQQETEGAPEATATDISDNPNFIAYSARASKTAARIAAAQAKAAKIAKERAEKEAEKATRKREKAEQKASKYAEDEAEAQRLQMEREAARAWQRKQNQEIRERARKYKDDKKAKQMDEKRQSSYLRGMAWGFDPSAGSRFSSADNGTEESRSSASNDKTKGAASLDVEEREDTGSSTPRRRERGTTWGIEHGGRGKDANFGHTSLRNRDTRVSSLVQSRDGVEIARDR